MNTNFRDFIKEEMTPWERKKAIEANRSYDRIPCVPFMGELKCKLTNISIYEFWHDPKKMEQTELAGLLRFGYDRITIGPNTRGITEALGGTVVYPEKGLPYIVPLLDDFIKLSQLSPINAFQNKRICLFTELGKQLMQKVGSIVPLEISIGGPFTIASGIRGLEPFLFDCRRNPDSVQKLLRIVTDTQKSCIDAAASIGLGIAMADPVANPALIGPKMYEEFVFPYTKELTEYAQKKTGQKVSLHMCGSTYRIWEYFCQYPLNELSLDNIVDIERAAAELGSHIPIAGNVDPVDIILRGSKQSITEAVSSCIKAGLKAKCGYTLATGCDIPETADLRQVDYFMEAARNYPY